ncbi:MAG: hypothetical protein DI536_18060 [Archangium gephyra]|uniref:DUF3806 domain-containing protein n=1 Tax=Archangium gephyra TaxID=48 RepID=A0A2W5TF16_9BACT|nr:MAG: hypothetical protein DI536_18060 [Archangium gephyra]
MPRIAIGDLTIDVDVPGHFRCEYTTNGSLLAEAGDDAFEIGVIRVTGNSGVDLVRDRAAQKHAEVHEKHNGVAVFFEAPDTWFAGFEEHMLIATVHRGASNEILPVLESVGAAHDPFPPRDERVTVPLRPSHRAFFTQRRTSMKENFGWSPNQHDAISRLDTVWRWLIEEPPPDEHVLHTFLSGIAVAFGDLLCQRGFSWGLGNDQHGITVGVVALQGTANVWVVPDEFLGKRWEHREVDFFGYAVEAIASQVEKLRTDGKYALS